MILFNITFAVSPQSENDFLEWVSGSFIPEINSCSSFSSPLLTRIIPQNPDECQTQSFALQFKADSVDTVHRWIECSGGMILDKIHSKHGEGVLSFATFMEIL